MNETIKIKIDGKELNVTESTPVLVAARNAGKKIPSMCFLEGKDHITSCMVCMVKDAKTGKLFPSCSVKAEQGMEILTMDEEIREARRMALELLLSEHVGDCEAPCQVTCPAHMNIPLMNRLLAKGEFHEALKVVKRDIAMPAVFGRICPAPCEGACHRKNVDDPVSICLLKRYAGDHDLLNGDPWMPERDKEQGKKVAIIGAGPAGLAAAWFLQLRGYGCEIFDRNQKAGGSLLEEVGSKSNEQEAGRRKKEAVGWKQEAGSNSYEELKKQELKEGQVLEQEILDSEIAVIERLGVKFLLNTTVDARKFEEISNSYDAVIISTGQGNSGVKEWGLEMDSRGIKADKSTYQVEDSSIFVTGSALKPTKMAIRTHGQGKETAFSVDQYLSGKNVEGEVSLFNSRFGKIIEEESYEYLKESIKDFRVEPQNTGKGLTPEEVVREAARCMHCDCRKMDNCRLRIYSNEYNSVQRRFKSEHRLQIVKHFQHEKVIYEPGKCIKCGICVKLCEENREELGLTHIGRGFEMVIGIPFHKDLKQALHKVASEVVEKCPTAALAWK